MAEPAPNATPTLDFDGEPLEPGAYFVDTDGDPETTTRGTFVIDNSGWNGLQPGVITEAPDDGYVSLLIVEVANVGSPACGSGATSQLPRGRRRVWQASLPQPDSPLERPYLR